MDANLLAVLLFLNLAKSDNVSPTLTLFTKYDGYVPINGYAIADISGAYKSLIHCTVACGQLSDCTGIKYRDTNLNEGVVCDILSARVSYLEATPGEKYLQVISGKNRTD